MDSADFDDASEEVLREIMGQSAAAPAPQPQEDTQDWENAAAEALAQVGCLQGACGPQPAQSNGRVELPFELPGPTQMWAQPDPPEPVPAIPSQRGRSTGQTDRQTDRQTNKQTNKRTGSRDPQRDRPPERKAHKHTHTPSARAVYTQMHPGAIVSFFF